ncbi:MAG: VacJ family lipoprotein [Geoalkalibacter sp.]|jgi:phospholipid-binding lipoprotein MlaA|uniref:MlaA family lipoprotein n=1 Tax=Geoalkalibacter sp. TaxID=3041440 RepID=UPI002A9E076D|nr:VacJ family lipoprotein [Thermodesulfobacteriota bacterium]
MKIDRRFGLTIIAAVVLLCAGCGPLVPPAPEPMRQVSQFVSPEKEYTIKVFDPLERVNRLVYQFNYYFDVYVFLPTVDGYRRVMPDYAEDRISNFFDNVLEINNLANCILQLKPKAIGITAARLVVNSTVGVLGLWDPASGWGLPRQEEDLGQTLGYFGIGNGPYLVLPVLGPSNLRDALGKGGDLWIFNEVDPFNFENNPFWISLTYNTLNAIDTRKRTPFRYYSTGSPFEYEWIRLLYTEKRFLQIMQ